MADDYEDPLKGYFSPAEDVDTSMSAYDYAQTFNPFKQAYDAGQIGAEGYEEGSRLKMLLGGLGTAMALPIPGMPKGKLKYPTAKRDKWWSDANYETTGGRMTKMSPDEYLAKVRSLEIDDVSRENIDILKKHMQEGRDLDPLAIYKSGKEDGRHRAWAAKELGIDKVPVLRWDEAPANPTKGQRAVAAAVKQGVPDADRLGVVHNMTGDNLRFVNNRYDAQIPVPSLAVTKPSVGIGGFGEVSLIGNPSMAAPSAKNLAFAADGYTPRFPAIETKLASRDAKKTRDTLNEILGPRLTEENFPGYTEPPIRDYDLLGDIERHGFNPERIDSVGSAYLQERGRLPALEDFDSKWSWRSAVQDELRKDPADMSQWSGDFFNRIGVEPKERIFAGYTYGGDRRYKPHTLDNVVRAMKGGADDEGFNYGLGSTRAAISPRFRSIADMQAARDRIQPRAALDEAKESLEGERLEQLLGTLNRYDEYPSDRFGAYDTMLARLNEAYQGGAYRPHVLEEYYPGITKSEADMDELRSFISDTRNMPTEYFEVKPQRAVGIEEFEGAIVPEGVSQDVLDILGQRGVNQIETYAPGDDVARANKMLKFKDHLFAPAAAVLGASAFYDPEEQ